MAGLRPGLFTRARLPPRGSTPNRRGHQNAQEGRRGVFLQVCRVREGEALKTRLRRFLELSTTAETVLRMHGRRDTPPPRRPMAVEGERRLQRLPPIPPPFPPAGRERVALCRQGCSRRGASLPCLPPAGERRAAPAASRGRVLALRAAGRTNPLTRHPLKTGFREWRNRNNNSSITITTTTPKGNAMALSPDIKERIFAAADQLHAASETGEFPSVEGSSQKTENKAR